MTSSVIVTLACTLFHFTTAPASGPVESGRQGPVACGRHGQEVIVTLKNHKSYGGRIDLRSDRQTIWLRLESLTTIVLRPIARDQIARITRIKRNRFAPAAPSRPIQPIRPPQKSDAETALQWLGFAKPTVE